MFSAVMLINNKSVFREREKQRRLELKRKKKEEKRQRKEEKKLKELRKTQRKKVAEGKAKQEADDDSNVRRSGRIRRKKVEIQER